jgi:PAS domain S-box-containing protein
VIHAGVKVEQRQMTEPELHAALQRARSQIAALEQLLEVHEQTSLEQATRLEGSLTERSEALVRERAARIRLSESEERLRLALDAGRMGTWEWDIVAGHVAWSPEEERLYGLASGSFSGTLTEYRERMHPEDRSHSVTSVEDALARHAPTHHVTHRILRADGQVRWLESHGRFVYGEDGSARRLVGVSTDVTDRLEIEAARDRALAEARIERSRLHEVFMQAPAAITVLDGPDHVFSVVNPLYRELLGGRDVQGKTVREGLPELEGQGFYELLDRVFESGKPFSAHESLVRLDRDGDGVPEDLFVDFVYQPLKSADGRVVGIMAHAVDVTAQVEARRLVEEKVEALARLSGELAQSNQELDQFAYVASHDLKAPLRGIANLAQWIEEDLADKLVGESREHMRLLKGRVHRMEALIDGILAYSRAGRVREKLERVDVQALLEETIELLAPPEAATVIVEAPMPVVFAERVPLQQVFMNLIGNALKYSDRSDTRVTVRAAAQGTFVRFWVVDNGPGIAPQFQEKVWQIFQTLAPRDKIEGTGIGLSVVRKLVESRGGSVWLESTPGEGSTFSFTWPNGQGAAP